jgi:hypothetical protein
LSEALEFLAKKKYVDDIVSYLFVREEGKFWIEDPTKADTVLELTSPKRPEVVRNSTLLNRVVNSK